MQSSRSIEPPESAVPGVIPAPVGVHDEGGAAYEGVAADPTPGEPSEHADPRDASKRTRGPFAKLLSVVRGDKYMAGAYEPAWSTAMDRRTRGDAAAGASSPKER
jgi:hypothetical protein